MRPNRLGYPARVPQDVDNAVGGRGGRDDEQPIELRRHLDALRRSGSLIVALVVLITVLGPISGAHFKWIK